MSERIMLITSFDIHPGRLAAFKDAIAKAVAFARDHGPHGPDGLQFHVGVDAHGFAPVPMSSTSGVRARMACHRTSDSSAVVVAAIGVNSPSGATSKLLAWAMPLTKMAVSSMAVMLFKLGLMSG